MSNPLNLEVGDTVQLDLDADTTYRQAFGNQSVLTVAQVDTADPICTYRLKAPGGNGMWVHRDDIIVPKFNLPKRKFNDGDILRIVKRVPGVGFEIGEIVKVLSHNPSENWKYYCVSLRTELKQHVDEGQLEPVDDNTSERGFKIGDKVRLRASFLEANRNLSWVAKTATNAMTIQSIDENSIEVKESPYIFSSEWLERAISTCQNAQTSDFTGWLSEIRCAFQSHKNDKPITVDLIETNKLLTTIKLD